MTDGLSARLEQIKEDVAAAVGPATFKAMEHLHQVAVNKTPIETGNLRAESSVEEIPNGARVYYPGPYARYQHYELQLRHEHGGQALYLEQPLVQETPAIMEILAQEMRKAIE